MYDTSDRYEALVKQYVEWSSNDGMPCYPSKGKEIALRKIGCTQVFRLVSSISQTRALSILGVTFQEDCPFTTHVRKKLRIKADKCLFILRSLPKEGYTQAELDYLFQSLVIPNGYQSTVLLMQSLRLYSVSWTSGSQVEIHI